MARNHIWNKAVQSPDPLPKLAHKTSHIMTPYNLRRPIMWTTLCEKNVDLFDNHKVAYAAITSAYAFAVCYGFGRFTRKLAEDESIKK